MHAFDQDTVIVKGAEGIYQASVSDHWSVNHNPNGGYLLTLLAKAMEKESEKTTPIILTASYITRGIPDKGEIHVSRIAETTQFDRLQAQLIQEGTPRVHAVGTFSDGSGDTGEDMYEAEPPIIAKRELCVPIPPIPDYSIYDGVDVRLDPECARWFTGTLQERSELKGWIRFREDRPHDTGSILLMADAFPPPVLASRGLVAWVPTLELTISIRNQPTSSWLKACFRSRFITGGILEEDGELWDENGTLIAISRQIAQYRKMPTA